MNGMGEKEERDERNDRAYAQWTLQQARLTQIRLIGRPHVIHHNLSGVVLVQTAKGHRYRMAFSGVSWETLAAFIYAPSSKQALAAARKALRNMLDREDGVDSIIEVPVPARSREESRRQIQKLLNRDKPGYLLGKPIR